jgi:hypothetical protein
MEQKIKIFTTLRLSFKNIEKLRLLKAKGLFVTYDEVLEYLFNKELKGGNLNEK